MKNNCYWNIKEKCTNPKITRCKQYKIGQFSGRDWDSKITCTYTQDGAQALCLEYKFRGN